MSIGLELKSKCLSCPANQCHFKQNYQYLTFIDETQPNNNSGLGGIGRNKGILGFLGGALCCFPLNYRMLALAKFGAKVPGGQASIALAALALGIAGAFADLAVPTPAVTMPKKIWGVKVPPFHLDDNFVVPVVSGYACTKVFQALGWQQHLELARFLVV